MHRKLLKYIQDSDVAITILLFAIAGLSFRGVPDNIWNDYLYIDWVFPLASSYILFIIATIFLKSVANRKTVSGAIFTPVLDGTL